MGDGDRTLTLSDIRNIYSLVSLNLGISQRALAEAESHLHEAAEILDTLRSNIRDLIMRLSEERTNDQTQTR